MSSKHVLSSLGRVEHQKTFQSSVELNLINIKDRKEIMSKFKNITFFLTFPPGSRFTSSG